MARALFPIFILPLLAVACEPASGTTNPVGAARASAVTTATVASLPSQVSASAAAPTVTTTTAAVTSASPTTSARASASPLAIPKRANASYVGRRTVLDGCKTRAIDPADPVDGGGWNCSPFGGYKLDISFRDERVFLSLVRAGNKPQFRSLDAISKGSFSGIDKVVEWRVPASKPASPATVIASINWGFPIVGRAFAIYLLTQEGSCLAAAVDASVGNSRTRARVLADRIAGMDRCPSPPVIEKMTKPLSTEL